MYVKFKASKSYKLIKKYIFNKLHNMGNIH